MIVCASSACDGERADRHRYAKNVIIAIDVCSIWQRKCASAADITEACLRTVGWHFFCSLLCVFILLFFEWFPALSLMHVRCPSYECTTCVLCCVCGLVHVSATASESLWSNNPTALAPALHFRPTSATVFHRICPTTASNGHLTIRD